MFSMQTKGWVGTGALKFSSAMTDNKKATDKQHWAHDSKQPSGLGLSGVWENIFHSFCSSASGKYNLLRLVKNEALKKYLHGSTSSLLDTLFRTARAKMHPFQPHITTIQAKFVSHSQPQTYISSKWKILLYCYLFFLGIQVQRWPVC